MSLKGVLTKFVYIQYDEIFMLYTDLCCRKGIQIANELSIIGVNKHF